MTTEQSKDITQQEFLRDACEILGLEQKQMAARMCAPWTTFKKWLQPTTAKQNYREMPDIAWQLVREILAHERLKKKIKKPQAKP